MPKSNIKRDEHGLYFLTRGGVYRPQASSDSYSMMEQPDRLGYNVVLSASSTEFSEGDKVNVLAIRQAPHARARGIGTNTKEVWNRHGNYPTKNGVLDRSKPLPFKPR